MPAFNARGIQGNLKICDLQESLSRDTDRKLDKESAEDMLRIQRLFATGTTLHEHVIKEQRCDTGEYLDPGVLQFVGPEKDLPLYVVMAELLLANHTYDATAEGSYTELEHIRQKQDRGAEGTWALGVELGFTSKAFDFAGIGRPPEKKDLKIEYFVNGVLARVDFKHRNKVSSRGSINVSRCGGVRVERQFERPLIYRTRVASGHAEDSAIRRWAAVASLLAGEACSRGTNKFNGMPPSAELLSALSKMQPPQECRDHSDLGIIDIVVTAGQGQKYGPRAHYIDKPTRMDDTSLSATDSIEIKSLLNLCRRASSPQSAEVDKNHRPVLRRDNPPCPNDQYRESAIAEDAIARDDSYVDELDTPSKKSRDNVDLNRLHHSEYEDMQAVGDANDDSSIFLGDPTHANHAEEDIQPCGSDRANSTVDQLVISKGKTSAINAENTSSQGLHRLVHVFRNTTAASRTPRRSSRLKKSPASTPNQNLSSARHLAQRGPETGPWLSVGSGNTRSSQNHELGTRGVPIEILDDNIGDGHGISDDQRDMLLTACKGSCVSFVEDDRMKRLIPKARAGEFMEEELIVAMRFIVV